MVAAIQAGTWQHYPVEKKRKGSAKFTFSREHEESKLTFNIGPSMFLLQPRQLKKVLLATRDKFVKALRVFPFDKYTYLG